MTEGAELATPESLGITQYSYSVAELEILLESTVNTEIVEQRDIFPIPHAPQWCHGMVSLRGKLIPVVNIHRMLGYTLEDTSSHWLLIIEANSLPPVAIRIDKLPVQHKIKPDELQVASVEALPFWITRSTVQNGKRLYEANHTELFQLLTVQNQQAQFKSVNTPDSDTPETSGIDA
jgi:chemotaxis signal transduction protein